MRAMGTESALPLICVYVIAIGRLLTAVKEFANSVSLTSTLPRYNEFDGSS